MSASKSLRKYLNYKSIIALGLLVLAAFAYFDKTFVREVASEDQRSRQASSRTYTGASNDAALTNPAVLDLDTAKMSAPCRQTIRCCRRVAERGGADFHVYAACDSFAETAAQKCADFLPKYQKTAVAAGISCD